MADILHFKPSNGWFGDPMPVWRDGVYHIYYTKRFEDEKIGWGHVATEDFTSCVEYPDPFEHGTPGTPFNTGCVFYGEGRFHAFYAGETADKRPAMLHAESDDGISFKPDGRVLFAHPGKWYRSDGTWRDPSVFYDEKSGLYRMSFCTKAAQGEPDCFAGLVAQAVSRDLVNWKCVEPLNITGTARTFECPEVFYDAKIGRYVLIYYWHETRFRTAESIEGPWTRSKVLSPDHFDFMAARSMFDGNRRYLIGWIPRRNCDCMERIWGGHMLFPRELTIGEDGTPSTRFAPALWQLFNKPAEGFEPEKASRDEGVRVENHVIRAMAADRGTLIRFPVTPDPFALRMKVKLTLETASLTLIIGAHLAYWPCGEELDEGYQVIFDRAERMVRLRKHYMWDQRNDIAVIPFDVDFDGGFNVELIVKDVGQNAIIELSVDGRQTLVSRLLGYRPGVMAMSFQDTRAEIEGFEVFGRGDTNENK